MDESRDAVLNCDHCSCEACHCGPSDLDTLPSCRCGRDFSIDQPVPDSPPPTGDKPEP
ncbi:hypothetical protein [Motiliproteus sp. SC1-56]|uniref:hypothetical protein n=1 Tax=Motiliproteus sp. SC1-56 TaxID=2799565 RepID=UPI001A8EA254|nr:hypothetical protein [Motiliproteus sp. SC1-56]